MDVSFVLDKLGIAYEEKGDRLIACCPFHSEKTPSFSIYRTSGHYNCFGCGAKGNLHSLVLQLTGKTVSELTGVNYNFVVKKQVEKELKNKKFLLEGSLDPIHSNVRVQDFCWSIGFTNSFIDVFNIRYTKEIKINASDTKEENKKTYWNRIVIPCSFQGHDYTYELRDYTRKSSKKVLYPVGSESDILFNFDNIDRSKTVFIVEGIKGLSKIWSYYSKNVVSTFGKIVKENQKKLIKTLPYICLVPDNDENKIDHTTKIPINNIQIMTNIYEDFYDYEYEIAYIPYIGKDPNDLSRSQIKEVLNNRSTYSDMIVRKSGIFDGTNISNGLYMDVL